VLKDLISRCRIAEDLQRDCNGTVPDLSSPSFSSASQAGHGETDQTTLSSIISKFRTMLTSNGNVNNGRQSEKLMAFFKADTRTGSHPVDISDSNLNLPVDLSVLTE
jgi:hypothetical protein